MAFEEAMKETARRRHRKSRFSIYIHGHSTGGPFAHDGGATNPHVSGTSATGFRRSVICIRKSRVTEWQFPSIGCGSLPGLTRRAIFTKGMKDRGIGLPMLMEPVRLERWEMEKRSPYSASRRLCPTKLDVTHSAAAARASAERLTISGIEKPTRWFRHHLGYAQEAFRYRREAGPPPFL